MIPGVVQRYVEEVRQENEMWAREELLNKLEQHYAPAEYHTTGLTEDQIEYRDREYELDWRDAQKAARRDLRQLEAQHPGMSYADMLAIVDRQNERAIEGNRAIEAARKLGYDTQMERLVGTESIHTIQTLQDVAHHAQKFAGTFAEVARQNGTTRHAEEYRRGENKAIADWYWKQKPRIDLAERLAEYASLPHHAAGASNAEQLIARNLAQQIYEGRSSLDLTQHYATDDPARASGRQERAIQTLEPFLCEARALGYSVERGQAIAEQFREAEHLAIQTDRLAGFSQGVRG